MSQDSNQNPQNNYPQGQPYEPTQAASSPQFDSQGNPPPLPYNPLASGQASYTDYSMPSSPYAPPPAGQAPYNPPPSSGYGNYPDASGYAPGMRSNLYENQAPYGSYPQPGTFPPPGGGLPYYQPPQQPKKSKAWLWVTLGVVGGILVLGIVGCMLFTTAMSSLVKSVNSDMGTSTAITTNTYDSTPVSASTSVSDSTLGPGETNISPAAVGKTNTLQDVDCTVTSIRKVPGDNYAQPKAGDEYIVIHVKLTNHSSKLAHYNPLDFKITDSQGKSFEHTYIVPNAYESQLSFGYLKTNDSIEGNLVFEVSSSDHTQTFNWNPISNDFSTNPGVANWTLNL